MKERASLVEEKPSLKQVQSDSRFDIEEQWGADVGPEA
jgi:hypothetical protein